MAVLKRKSSRPQRRKSSRPQRRKSTRPQRRKSTRPQRSRARKSSSNKSTAGGCFQISNKKYARKDFGLPEDKFIFCCFNNVIKINPEVFSAWTEILKNNENSVLWLSSENEIVINNLKSEAKYKGINEKRLIFTKKLPQDDYLKLFKLADLFLDTIPYNAGATAIDSLYAGLPILTMSGDSFVSRISGSLMHSLNMKELIANSLADYVNLASSICKNNKIDEIKSKLTKQIKDSNLFNSKVYTKNIEDAFFKILYAYQNNLKNNDIYI